MALICRIFFDPKEIKWLKLIVHDANEKSRN